MLQQATQLLYSRKLVELMLSINGELSVIVDIVAPGFCKSELLTREPEPMALKAVQFLTARTLPEGGKTIVDTAVRGKEVHGKYLDHQ